MRKQVWNFFKGEDGAVTVDWVVLTAAIVGMGTLVIFTIAGGATSQADGVGTRVGDFEVGYQNLAD